MEVCCELNRASAMHVQCRYTSDSFNVYSKSCFLAHSIHFPDARWCQSEFDCILSNWNPVARTIYSTKTRSLVYYNKVWLVHPRWSRSTDGEVAFLPICVADLCHGEGRVEYYSLMRSHTKGQLLQYVD